MPTVLLLREASQCASLATALGEVGYRVVAELDDAAALDGAVSRLHPDVIVVSNAKPANATLDALGALAASRPRPVVMFAQDASRNVIRRAVECGVAAYVIDGWAQGRLGAIIEAATARFEAYEAMRRELATTQNKLAERKLVEKAKGIVMQQRGVNEELAYGALRKMAMDQNLTLAEVARRVIAVTRLLA